MGGGVLQLVFTLYKFRHEKVPGKGYRLRNRPLGDSREMRGCDEYRTSRDVVIRSNTPYRCGVDRH